MSAVTSKVRLYDLAKELKIDTKRLIEEVRREGVDVNVPSNSVSKELAEKIRDKYFPKKDTAVKRAVKVVKKAARPVVEEPPAVEDEVVAPVEAAASEPAAAEPEVAPQITPARVIRKLSPAAVAVVDAAVADAIAGESPARVLEIAEAKIIEVDTVAHRAALDAERRRRYVGLGRTDEFGLRQVIARVAAGDAVWVDATIDRVADILATRPDLRPDTPAEIERDELRALAFGWLARPAELLTLLLEAAGDDPGAAPEPEPTRALAPPAATLERLQRQHLTRLRPNATLHVHLHEAALAGFRAGVARVEEIGPMLLSQVRELLGHCNVRLQPVIDLHDRVSVNSYEFPEAIKERVHLTHPGEVLPHAARKSRKVDVDHPEPYEPGGPPGQTGTHNAGPLGRTGHRAKTHLGYTVTQTERGDHVWRTPHGLHRIVDERGTHVLDQAAAAALTSDDPLDRVLAQLMLQVRTGVLGPPPTSG